MLKLSIIIPAYNEEKRIESTLNSYASFLNKKFKNRYEIIVVPNNCKDRTVQIVSRISKKNKNIKIKEIKHFVGKAGAIIEGFKLAKGDLIGFVDADNSAPPDSFYKLIEKQSGYDGAIASRWIEGAEIKLKQPIMRRVFSRTFNFLVRIFLGLKYYDTQCGAKVFKKDKIKKIIHNLGKSRWAFDVDILYQLKKINSKIIEVPIKWSDDPRTHLDLTKAPLQMFLAIIRLRLKYSNFRFIIAAYDKLPEKLKFQL